MIFSPSLATIQGFAIQASLVGSFAVVGSAVSGGLGSVVVKKYASGIDPVASVLVQSIVGAVALTLVAIGTERVVVFEFSARVIVAVLYLGVVGSAFAFVAWYWLFTKTTATNSSLVLFVTPMVALILGWVILHERVEPIVAFGTALILAGVYGTVVQGRGSLRS